MSLLPQHDRLTYVIGSPETFIGRPLAPFSVEVKTFLAQLSEALLSDPAVRPLPDIISFAYWCRKANLERQSTLLEGDGRLRLGRGIAFHIPPANVPVNFAFSWAFSMLAGNANVTRLSTREFPQVPAILRHVETLLADEQHGALAAMNVFVRYAYDAEITAAFSALCDVRIVWGGDEAVKEIRKSPLSLRSIDIAFPDRTSLSVLGADTVLGMTDEALAKLAGGFYNDTYLMDQNACSSPRLVAWLGVSSAGRARERFWSAVEQETSRRGYSLVPISAVDKLVQVCRDAIELERTHDLRTAGNVIYRLGVDAVPSGLDLRRCNCGYFYEIETDRLDELAEAITWRYQTLTYAGVRKEDLAQFVSRQRMPGIDRIVPVGEAMDIGLLWDGYDLANTLSRICDVR